MHAWRMVTLNLVCSEMVSTTNLIQVVAGLVFHEKKLLITQRPLGRHLGGLWEFPGGKLEPGEGLVSALKRELLEELAIEVEVLELLGEVTHSYPEKSVRLSFFRCRWTGGDLQCIDCSAHAWVSLSELNSYLFPEADREMLLKMHQNPEWWITGNGIRS